MIKTILVLSDALSHFEVALTSALELGRRLAAHVDVLHIEADPLSLAPFGANGVPASVQEQMKKALEADIEKRRTGAREIYERLSAASDASVSWHAAIGDEAEIAAAAGRLRDLTVIGRPEGTGGTDLAADAPWRATLHAVLFNSGRPVLLLPQRPLRVFGERIAVAWNGSAEAARAVAGALPFLRLAEQVTILSGGAVDPHASPAGLAACLARHGVRVAAREFEPSYMSIGSALLDQSRLLGADLLVMGAYGHSRFREIILGGATREVLPVAELPVLMAR